MNKKTNYILRLMLGMYLAFIGVNLIRETLAAHPSDLAFKLFMGIIFAIIGAGYTIWIIKRMVSSKKAEQAEQKREEAAEAALKKMETTRTHPKPHCTNAITGRTGSRYERTQTR